jgi:hypothetical protein
MQTIYVYYEGNDFDKAIAAAYRRHGLKPGQAQIIAMPRESRKVFEKARGPKLKPLNDKSLPGPCAYG